MSFLDDLETTDRPIDGAAGLGPRALSREATAQVVSVGPTTGMINLDPIVPMRLLVFEDGAPPRPVAASVVVPMARLAQVRQGATVRVRLIRTDPPGVTIFWS